MTWPPSWHTYSLSPKARRFMAGGLILHDSCLFVVSCLSVRVFMFLNSIFLRRPSQPGHLPHCNVGSSWTVSENKTLLASHAKVRLNSAWIYCISLSIKLTWEVLHKIYIVLYVYISARLLTIAIDVTSVHTVHRPKLLLQKANTVHKYWKLHSTVKTHCGSTDEKKR